MSPTSTKNKTTFKTPPKPKQYACTEDAKNSSSVPKHSLSLKEQESILHELATTIENYKSGTSTSPAHEHHNTFVEYAYWVCSPPAHRNPKKLADFAAKHGISPHVLCQWKRGELLWKVIKVIEQDVAKGLLPDWFEGMQKGLKRGDVSMMKLYREMFDMEYQNKMLALKSKTDKPTSIVININKEIEALNKDASRIVDAEVVEINEKEAEESQEVQAVE